MVFVWVLVLLLTTRVCLFSYSYGGYATGESSQVGAQPVYSVNVQQVNVHNCIPYFIASMKYDIFKLI